MNKRPSCRGSVNPPNVIGVAKPWRNEFRKLRVTSQCEMRQNSMPERTSRRTLREQSAAVSLNAPPRHAALEDVPPEASGVSASRTGLPYPVHLYSPRKLSPVQGILAHTQGVPPFFSSTLLFGDLSYANPRSVTGPYPSNSPTMRPLIPVHTSRVMDPDPPVPEPLRVANKDQ